MIKNQKKLNISDKPERTVTVASVRLPETDSVRISAYARLCGTKVEAIATDLMVAFIKRYVTLQRISTPTEKEYNVVINDYTSENTRE